MLKIGIIGGGFVGGATSLLSSEQVQTLVYDLDPKKCKPEGTTFEDILQTEGVFICVWTPITTTENDYGKCNTKLVESIIKQLRDAEYKGYIIVRSTVPVGFCKSQGVYFMPEFLTEKNWKYDFLNCEKWIFGWNMSASKEEIQSFTEWMTKVIHSSNVTHKNIAFVDSNSAECIKYTRNCFLSVKISFFNELYQFTQSHGIDYETIKELATDDKRVGKSHTSVPGHDNYRGFGGHCFPKDCASWEYQLKEKNVRSDIISAANKRNNEVDRPEKDWLN